MVGVADGEEVDFVVGEETVIGVAVDVDTDAHDGDTFVLETLLELDEGRHFLDAGRAPGGPEIQNQNLALKVAEVNFAVGILHDEFGGGGPDVRRTGATVAAGEEQGKGEKNGGASHTVIITNSVNDGV